MKIEKFTFGPFQENTYVLYDDTKECVIVDPGCYSATEQIEMADFILKNGLKAVLLLNTHCHIDHVNGNLFVFEKFGLKPIIHRLDLPVLASQEQASMMYGLPFEKSPEPEKFIEEGDKIKFGKTVLDVLFTPGHCPGHVTFYHKESGTIVSGDVLFYNSIGRTDLPGGDHATLIRSVKTKLFPLGDDVKVYCGHGPETTIGFERRTNPFLV
ncbi:MAG: MBL fold metallo-hydrolase [Bacteroidia bacterium]|nr:MBL fold metallo-hydrolase [Bacteroidia bacterium]